MEQQPPPPSNGDDPTLWNTYVDDSNYPYSASTETTTPAIYDPANYPAAPIGFDQSVSFAAPANADFHRWDATDFGTNAAYYPQEHNSQLYNSYQNPSYAAQNLNYGQQSTTWHGSPQPLVASTSFGSVADLSSGGAFTSPYPDDFVTSNMLENGVGGLSLQASYQQGIPHENTPYLDQAYASSYMPTPYIPEYPQVPAPQLSPVVANGGPVLQATAGIPLSRTSSKSSKASVVERTKKTLTEEEKLRICQLRESRPGMTQIEMGAVFNVDRSTISKVLKSHKEKLHRQANNIPESPPVKATKSGTPRFQRLENAMNAWFDQKLASNISVSDASLAQRARLIAREQNNTVFKCSGKWISLYKDRRISDGKTNKPLAARGGNKGSIKGNIVGSQNATPDSSGSSSYGHTVYPNTHPNTPMHYYTKGPLEGIHKAPGMAPFPARTLVDIHPAVPQTIEAGSRSVNASPAPSQSRPTTQPSPNGSNVSRPSEGLVRSRSNTLDAPLGTRALTSSGKPRLQRHQTSASLDWRKKSMGASALGLLPPYGPPQTQATNQPAPIPIAAHSAQAARPRMHVRARSDVTGWGLGAIIGTTPDLSEGDARSVKTPLMITPIEANGQLMPSLPVPEYQPSVGGRPAPMQTFAAEPPRKRTRRSLAMTAIPRSGGREAQHIDQQTQHHQHHQAHVMSQQGWAMASQ